MVKLFKKYINDGNKSDALLVGQNLFNKNKGDKEIFDLYFSLLASIANSNHAEADKFIEQLISVLSIYSENADLDENEVLHIRDCEKTINSLVQVINGEKETKKIDSLKAIILSNDSLLKHAKENVENLKRTVNREEFNKLLKEIYSVDGKFDQTNFVKRQKIEYEEITEMCKLVVDSKLKEFERTENIEYNKKAIASYEKVFNLFSDSENSHYKNGDILELFSYDSSKLTNETLIYYNHVYNFILSKMDEKEKITLTKLAIIAEKKG